MSSVLRKIDGKVTGEMSEDREICGSTYSTTSQRSNFSRDDSNNLVKDSFFIKIRNRNYYLFQVHLVAAYMNINYDKDADCLYIQFQQGKVYKTRKIEEGILLDIDEKGKIYGIEIVGVSERMPLTSLGKINIDMQVGGVPA